MKRLLLIALCAGAVGGVSFGGVGIRLEPRAAVSGVRGGLLPARLHVADANASLPAIVRAVRVRRRAGGPVVWYETAIAPNSTQALDVLLPVASAQEVYVVRLLAGAGTPASVLAEREVPVDWPAAAAAASREALIDPAAYDAYAEELPLWGGSLLRWVFLAAVLGCAALAAALLIRRPFPRLAAVAIVLAAGTFIAWHVLTSRRVLVVREADGLLAVTSRRTAAWTAHRSDLVCVFASPGHLDADGTECWPGERLRVVIRPHEVRLFRALPAATAATAPAGD
jgi:hypothetical protein